MLLRSLRPDLHSGMVKYFGSDYIDNESQSTFVIGYLFEIVAASDKDARRMGLGLERRSAMLLKAAEVLGTFMEGLGEKSRGVKKRAMALTDCIVHAYHTGQLDERYAQA